MMLENQDGIKKAETDSEDTQVKNENRRYALIGLRISFIK